MKKIIAILLTLTLCLGLCACGTEASPTEESEEIVLPTIPQISVPTLPAREDSEETAVESTEPVEPTGETHPWETEFTGEGYNLLEGGICDIVDYTKTVGKIYQWLEGDYGSACARQLWIYDSGEVKDTYFYPAPNLTESHSYKWGADGSYEEYRYLDDGHRVISADESVHDYMGTMVYHKIVNADGSWEEYQRSDDDSSFWEILQNSDGYYREERYFENGERCKYVLNDPAAGIYQEEVHYECGQLMRYVFEDSQTNQYTESEYFEGGSLKFSKSQTPDYTLEEQYDEEGFHTYLYSKSADYELELTADETGMLVKVIENGEVKEDAATLTQYAQNYNFRQ